MITRRQLLTGIAAGVTASVAASTLIRAHKPKGQGDYQVYDRPMVQDTGFGLARPKPEGGTYYVDPMDDPAYRGPKGQHGKYATKRDPWDYRRFVWHGTKGKPINGRGHQS